MTDDDTRLDRAMAILKASDEPGSHANRWTAVSECLRGLLLTDASEEVLEAIESFGLQCNAIMSKYKEGATEVPIDYDEADASELVERTVQLAELIREDESDRIMARLRSHGGILPEPEIIEARRHRDWFISLLLQETQAEIDLHAEHGRVEDEEDNSIPFFSFYLFSEWQVRESVPLILQGLHLPRKGPFDLFGDAIHEHLHRYLAQFLADDLPRIDDLVRNPDGNPYVRWVAANSYQYLVRDKVISVAEAVVHLDRLFNEIKIIDEHGDPESEHPYEVSSGIATTIAGIGGASQSILSQHDEEWAFVDQFFVSRNEFVAIPAGDDDTELSSQLLRLPPTCVEDTVEELRRWVSFKTTEKRPQQPPAPRPRDRVRPPSRARPQPKVTQPPVDQVASSTRVPRNAKCPCGSGKKFKQCCLRQKME